MEIRIDGEAILKAQRQLQSLNLELFPEMLTTCTQRSVCTGMSTVLAFVRMYQLNPRMTRMHTESSLFVALSLRLSANILHR